MYFSSPLSPLKGLALLVHETCAQIIKGIHMKSVIQQTRLGVQYGMNHQLYKFTLGGPIWYESSVICVQVK